jgi:hypothetical protein
MRTNDNPAGRQPHVKTFDSWARDGFGIKVHCSTVYVEDLYRIVMAERSKTAALVNALREVEWGAEPHTDDSECPYCLCSRKVGHDEPCAVRVALAQGGGGNG